MFIRQTFTLGTFGFVVMMCGCASPDAFLREDFASRKAGFADADKVGASYANERQADAPAEKSTPARLVAHTEEPSPTLPKDRRVVIYNAGLRIVVTDTTAARQEAERLADELGGYVQKIDGDTITLRVPVAHYQDAIGRLERFGQVSHRELEALDVTEEFVDLEARLKNARNVRTRLEALLAKAEDVKAALEVEKELTRVTEEIERLEAKLEMIRNRVAYSTITIWLERVARTAVVPRRATLPFTWLRQLDPARLVN